MKKNQLFSKKEKIILAIDEVGRGAIAGPLVLGGLLCCDNKETRNLLKNIKDSKKLTFHQRLTWFKKFKLLKGQFYTVFISNKLIDKKGMGWAIKEGVKRLCEKAKIRPSMVLLDGGLKAPKIYKQRTIIKGDEKNCFISAAAIYAKVKRDLYMIKLEKKFAYRFDNHKGYGTKKHIELIRKNGISDIHRKSFLNNILSKNKD